MWDLGFGAKAALNLKRSILLAACLKDTVRAAKRYPRRCFLSFLSRYLSALHRAEVAAGLLRECMLCGSVYMRKERIVMAKGLGLQWLFAVGGEAVKEGPNLEGKKEECTTASLAGKPWRE